MTNHNSTYTLFFLIIILSIGLNQSVQAQTKKELLQNLEKEEQQAIHALVLYPIETRKIILEATKYPQALIKMESIQNRTSIAFKELVETLPQEDQQTVWDLTRYPGLVQDLANHRIDPNESILEILEAHPKVIHRRALNANVNMDLPLVPIDELNQAAESAFQKILSEYPPSSQQYLNEIIQYPEVLSMLTDNIKLTLLVGEIYRNDPNWVTRKADSLNLALAQQNAKELNDWEANLEDDPEAMKEFIASVEKYNEENVFDDEYYDADDTYKSYDGSGRRVTLSYHYNYNYPYWFSYPYWYTYPRWNCYPIYYDYGFHHYSTRPMFFGMPSGFFMDWYFHNHHHHHHYSHLSAHFVNHYYGHRTSGSISRAVSDWQYSNREYISDKWMKNDGKLSTRFKEYGQFEDAFDKYNKKHPNNKVSKREFLGRDKDKFKALSKSNRSIVNKKDNKPAIRKPRTVKPTKKKTTKKTTKKPRLDSKPVSKKKDTSVRKPSKKIPNTSRAKDYHKRSWEKINRKAKNKNQ